MFHNNVCMCCLLLIQLPHVPLTETSCDYSVLSTTKWARIGVIITFYTGMWGIITACLNASVMDEAYSIISFVNVGVINTAHTVSSEWAYPTETVVCIYYKAVHAATCGGLSLLDWTNSLGMILLWVIIMYHNRSLIQDIYSPFFPSDT